MRECQARRKENRRVWKERILFVLINACGAPPSASISFEPLLPSLLIPWSCCEMELTVLLFLLWFCWRTMIFFLHSSRNLDLQIFRGIIVRSWSGSTIMVDLRHDGTLALTPLILSGNPSLLLREVSRWRKKSLGRREEKGEQLVEKPLVAPWNWNWTLSSIPPSLLSSHRTPNFNSISN